LEEVAFAGCRDSRGVSLTPWTFPAGVEWSCLEVCIEETCGAREFFIGAQFWADVLMDVVVSLENCWTGS